MKMDAQLFEMKPYCNKCISYQIRMGYNVCHSANGGHSKDVGLSGSEL